MKILFVSNKYKRGELERGPNYGYHSFYDTLLKMDGQRHQIIFFPVDETLISMQESQEKVKEKLFQLILNEKPNLVFFLEGNLTRKNLREMARVSETVGAKTFWWVSDDHWMFYRVSRKMAPYFNWVATTDSRAPKRYVKIGYQNAIHSQYACNHFYYRPLALPKIYDVTFVGQPHGQRRQMVEAIRKAGINIKCWGYGWPQGVLPQEDMIKVFSQSKINLCFSGAGGKKWKNFAQIFLSRPGERKGRKTILVNNPLDWPNNFRAFLDTLFAQVKARHFEILGCGGFLLTDDADNLRDYYEDGKELVIFKNVKDLAEKIKYYLANDREREAIARAGLKRTLKDHTYEKRFNEIFKIMGLTKD